jgi:preprotein translocase subunit SecD
MKSIKLFLALFCILATLSSAGILMPDKTKKITLQATVKETSASALEQSAEIISSRLKLFGVKAPDIKVIGQDRLTVVIPDDTDLSKIERLLTARGDVTLKSNDGKSLVTRSDIESISLDNSRIMIRLKPSAVARFAEATRLNINKPISIVIDDRVYSSPVLKSVIENGELEVTGSFTAQEASFFPAIFNTEMLPLTFRIVE